MSSRAKELHATIVDNLRSRRLQSLSVGFAKLEELASETRKVGALDALRSSLLAQTASLWITSGREEDGYAVLFHLCLRDLGAGVWGNPYDDSWRDRHLGVVLDRHDGFTAWVEGMNTPPAAPELVASGFSTPPTALKDLDELLLDVAGKDNFCLEDTFAPGRSGRLAVLFQRGADPLARYDYNRTTCLHHLAAMGDGPAIRYAVSRGAEVDARDKNGQTPLFWAAKEKKGATAIRALVEAGADVAAKSERGRTALFGAAYGGSALAVSLLWELDADLEASVGETTPLAMAARSSNLPAARALVDAGAVVTAEARREAKDHNRFDMTAFLDSVAGVAPVPLEEARAAMEAVAAKLGRKAGIEAVDGIDYDRYREDDCEHLLVEQYWEAQFGPLMERAIAGLSEEAQAHLAGQEDLTTVLRSLYDKGFEAGVSR